ncbi:MAG: riboflavin synthase [Candidatus Micrarchaeota archaeon]|nr:riboflavin synthase [Candidatus Micrarchaeota archaeon]MDE1847830.1 riboflavin synthase [Candidatus Micrarchaeota archaeon]MDE1864364.1 riboflavin synthase [Candidatus Micrarchaeota archaeon]
MFTGIVECLGKVGKVERGKRHGSAMILSVAIGKSSLGLHDGDSVAINGVCLTAIRTSNDMATFEVMSETIKRTNIGGLVPGSKVNIERSLRPGQRIEGHFVLGHVDGTGKISKIQKQKNQTMIRIELPKELYWAAVSKGSIAVDGISLTVVDCGRDFLSTAIIPHTMKVTNLASRKVGDIVNIETDVLRKYALSRKRL